MGDQKPTERANELYDIAIQVISNARHSSFPKTDDLINQLAWGHRSWVMADQQIATAIRATYILLEKVDQRLERLERSLKR